MDSTRLRAAPALGDAPLPDDASPSLSAAELRAFLGRPETQARIGAVVRARVRKGTSAAVVDDLIQQANVAALTAPTPPRAATATAWVSTVTARVVALHFRGQSARDRWIDPDADVEAVAEASAEPAFDPDAANDNQAEVPWLIAPWLSRLVADDPRDRETYELLSEKARSGKTLDAIAADHGMTTAALKTRIHRFKEKYAPRWRRRQRAFMVFLFLFGAAVVVVAWLLARSLVAPPSSPRVDPAHPTSTVREGDPANDVSHPAPPREP